MQLRRVVVTGLGALTPVGNSAPETWAALINGVNGIAPITSFDATKFKTHFAGEVKGFDPSPLMDRKEARKMDRYSQFSVWVANEALIDSGLDLEKEDRSRVGVIWGSGMGGLQSTEEEIIDFAKGDGVPRFNPFMSRCPPLVLLRPTQWVRLLTRSGWGTPMCCSPAERMRM